MNTRWITFDCYGTLVDWHSGFSEILHPMVGEKTHDLLNAYHRHEPRVQAERPFCSYKEVLTISLGCAAEEIGVKITETQARLLPQQWSALPVFGDVEEALAQLRTAGCKLGVLTNCDEDLFAQTQRTFRWPFDLAVTAERVRDYKPSLTHFRFFAQTSRVNPADWVHVGCSWFHDMAPARELGIKRIWLDRDRTGDDPRAASVQLFSAKELPGAATRLFETA